MLQAIWSRTAKAAGCSCHLCHPVNAAVAGGQPVKARIQPYNFFGNGVTRLYSGIFASAALIDAALKDGRREELQRKIAEVNEEVERMKEEEARILASLSPRLSRRPLRLRNSLHIQTRNFSTSRRKAKPEATTEQNITTEQLLHTTSDYFGDLSFEIPEQSHATNSNGTKDSLYRQPEEPIDEFGDEDGGEESQPKVAESMEEFNKHQEDLLNFGGERDAPVSHGYGLEDDWVDYHHLRTRGIEQNAMKQLALRFLLRPRIAHWYEGYAPRYKVDYIDEVERSKSDMLIQELRRTSRRMKAMEKMPIEDVRKFVEDLTIGEQGQRRQERRALNKELQSLVRRYEAGHIDLYDLLPSICDNILSTSEPMTADSYEHILAVFIRKRDFDLAKMVVQAIIQTRIPLPDKLKMSLLYYFGQAKDYSGFQKLLSSLKGEGPWRLSAVRQWHSVQRGNTEVTLPPPPVHPHTMSALIGGYLAFDQPRKAHLCALELRNTGYHETPWQLRAFLRYHIRTEDWPGGKATILRTLAWMMQSTNMEFNAYLLLMMLKLSQRCDRPFVYEKLMSSILKSGVDMTEAKFRNHSNNPADQVIVDDWQSQRPLKLEHDAFNESIFHSELHELYETISLVRTPEPAGLALKTFQQHHLDLQISKRLCDNLSTKVDKSEHAIDSLALAIERYTLNMERRKMETSMGALRGLLDKSEGLVEMMGKLERQSSPKQQPQEYYDKRIMQLEAQIKKLSDSRVKASDEAAKEAPSKTKKQSTSSLKIANQISHEGLV